MIQDVTTEIKRQTRTQVSLVEQQVQEMERLLADVKTGLELVSEHGPAAMGGVSQRQTPAHLARVAAQLSKSVSLLEMLGNLTDAANAATCEERGW